MTVHDVRRASDAPVSLAPGVFRDELTERAQRVADIAVVHADDVDAAARFPAEAIGAAKAVKLLGVLAPRRLGGADASYGQVADVCYTLGRACASTAMVYAMHQVKVACIVRHGLDGNTWRQDFIRRLARDQLLLASSTTEGQNGGNVRSSEAAIERAGERISLVRDASVISYGESADAVVTTARRAADAAGSDQVLTVFPRDSFTLERTMGWDTLGMRGTCSAGFTLRGQGVADQILPVPYAVIHAQSMVPAAHIFWSSAWAGIAASAVEKARRYLRKAARGGGDMPPSAPYFTRANTSLRALRALIATTIDRYEAIADDPDELTTLEFQSQISLLKVDASELAVSAVMSALRCCGLSGFRNDSDVSIGRHLRDILSSPIMINNDRILANVAASALLTETPTSVKD